MNKKRLYFLAALTLFCILLGFVVGAAIPAYMTKTFNQLTLFRNNHMEPIEFPWSLRIGIIIAITATPLAKLATEIVNIFRVKSGSAPLCPNCGAFMKVRMAKRGDHIGKKFWGCRNYPRCRGIISNHE